MEQWAPIRMFPGYEVSNKGRVMNQTTGRIMALSRTRTGTRWVGLMRDGRQHTRAVSRLVAEAFVEKPIVRYNSDTPIHLDGDKDNNEAENLVWRPRWFAIRYAQQFNMVRYSITKPIQDEETGEIFSGSWEVATRFGLLDADVVVSVLRDDWVWPTEQKFRSVK